MPELAQRRLATALGNAAELNPTVVHLSHRPSAVPPYPRISLMVVHAGTAASTLRSPYVEGRNDFAAAALRVCEKTQERQVSAPGDHYRAKALELFAKAETESDPAISAEYEHLAVAFARLAEQAERNAKTDVTYEPPLPKLNDPKID